MILTSPPTEAIRNASSETSKHASLISSSKRQAQDPPENSSGLHLQPRAKTQRHLQTQRRKRKLKIVLLMMISSYLHHFSNLNPMAATMLMQKKTGKEAEEPIVQEGINDDHDGNGDGDRSSDNDNTEFCGSNKWSGTHISCKERSQYLVRKHHMSEQNAQMSLLKSESGGCHGPCLVWTPPVINITTNPRKSSIDSNNDNTTKAKSVDTKIIVKRCLIILLSLMTIIIVPTLLRFPAHVTWQSVGAQFCTSLIFHLQGLMALKTNDGRIVTMLQGLVGAGLEGVFLLSLMITLLSKHRRLWANGLVCLLGIAAIMILYFSMTFMRKTGLPNDPDMFMLMAGLRDARSYVKSAGTDGMWLMIKGLLWACGSALPSAFLVWKEGRRDYNDDSNGGGGGTEQRRQSILYFSVLFTALVIVYCFGAWAPIFHVYASVCGSFIFSPPGSSESYIGITAQRGEVADTAPNLILIIHESLSGEYTTTRKEAVELMPFLQEKFQANSDDFFLFENARTVSGDTTDCVPAIVTGCLALNDQKGKSLAYSNNMATQAKTRGYETLSFSSRELNMERTKWFMINTALSTNFDRIWHPKVTGEPHVNEAAQSDRLMGKHFNSWIQERDRSTTKTPFFAQFYNFDAHHPFYNDDEVKNKTSSRLDGMLMTVDKAIEDIFRYLDDAGELNNTIIIGSGDHGDTYAGGFGRLVSWDANVLRPLTYMYVPKRISARNPEIVINLNHNKQKLVSTLDLYPTMLHMLDGLSSKNKYEVTDNDCMRGYDLLSKKIDSERVAWSFPSNLHSNRGNLGVHYRRSSLVNRFGWPNRNGLKIVKYAETVGSNVESKETDDVLAIDDWKSLLKGIEGVNGMPRVGMSSQYMTKLLDILDRSSGTATNIVTSSK